MKYLETLQTEITGQDEQYRQVANREVRRAGEVSNLIKFLNFIQQPDMTIKEAQACAKLIQEQGINLITGKIV